MSDPVIIAIIGASASLIGLVVAKDSKISELRQQWIDGLRSDVATIVSLALQVAAGVCDLEVARKTNECLARVALRLNPDEQASIDLRDALNSLRVEAMAGGPRVHPLAGTAVEKTQVILKFEWRRVKRGEWRYVAILVMALASFFSCIGLLIFQWITR